MATKAADPKTPKSKPHATTKDQINEMESEGQAQTQGQPAPVHGGRRRTIGSQRPNRATK